jgi:hypothetical protein
MYILIEQHGREPHRGGWSGRHAVVFGRRPARPDGCTDGAGNACLAELFARRSVERPRCSYPRTEDLPSSLNAETRSHRGTVLAVRPRGSDGLPYRRTRRTTTLPWVSGRHWIKTTRMKWYINTLHIRVPFSPHACSTPSDAGHTYTTLTDDCQEQKRRAAVPTNVPLSAKHRRRRSSAASNNEPLRPKTEIKLYGIVAAEAVTRFGRRVDDPFLTARPSCPRRSPDRSDRGWGFPAVPKDLRFTLRGPGSGSEGTRT